MSDSVISCAAAGQACLSFIISQSLLKLMSIEWVMPSNHLVLCHSLLPLPSIFPSIRVFPNELALRTRWPEYWSFSFSISPSGLTLIPLQSKGLSRVFSSTTVQKFQFFGAQPSLWSNSHNLIISQSPTSKRCTPGVRAPPCEFRGTQFSS